MDEKEEKEEIKNDRGQGMALINTLNVQVQRLQHEDDEGSDESERKENQEDRVWQSSRKRVYGKGVENTKGYFNSPLSSAVEQEGEKKRK